MSFHSILVAVDGSRHSDAALAHAIELARDGNARLTILTATPQVPGVSLTGPAAAVAAANLDQIEHDFDRVLRSAVDRVPDDLPVTTVHAAGAPARAILNEAERGDHDLIVMGSRGLGLDYIPSHANFLTIKVGKAADVYKRLLRRGVIVRPVGGGYGLNEHLRVTVGTAAENERFLGALAASLKD